MGEAVCALQTNEDAHRRGIERTRRALRGRKPHSYLRLTKTKEKKLRAMHVGLLELALATEPGELRRALTFAADGVEIAHRLVKHKLDIT